MQINLYMKSTRIHIDNPDQTHKKASKKVTKLRPQHTHTIPPLLRTLESQQSQQEHGNMIWLPNKENHIKLSRDAINNIWCVCVHTVLFTQC